jgi:hypothetical protein
MYQPGNHHLADLGNSMSKSFRRGFGWLFSPAAPLGLLTIPATVAWGAMAAPFCLLGDLGDNGPSRKMSKSPIDSTNSCRPPARFRTVVIASQFEPKIGGVPCVQLSFILGFTQRAATPGATLLLVIRA